MFKVKSKKIALFLFVIVMIFAVTGCGGTEKSSDQSGQADQSSKKSSEPINLKLAYSVPATHHIGLGMTMFADEVKKRTNGQVTIQVFPNSQLYRDVDIPQAILNRSVDMGDTPAQQFASLIPAMEFPDVPFLFNSAESFRISLDEQMTDLLGSEMEKKGLKVLVWAEYGPTSFANNERIIKKPADLKGLQIRGRGKMSEEVIKALGATPTFISAAEQYEALQRGTVDGVDTGLTSMVSRKLYEVQKYLTITNSSWGVFPLAMNLKVWNDLPKDVQDVILEVSEETTKFIRDEASKAEAGALDTLKANKMEVYTVTPEELPMWREATQPVWDLYEQKSGEIGKKILELGQKNS